MTSLLDFSSARASRLSDEARASFADTSVGCIAAFSYALTAAGATHVVTGSKSRRRCFRLMRVSDDGRDARTLPLRALLLWYLPTFCQMVII